MEMINNVVMEVRAAACDCDLVGVRLVVLAAATQCEIEA